MNLNQFKANFNGGTRSNRFRLSGTFPSVLNLGSYPSRFDDFHVRSATMLPSALNRIEMDHFGRKTYLPGDRDYLNFTIQVYDDRPNNMSYWHSFMKWQEYINNLGSNFASTNLSNNYKMDGLYVDHLDLNCSSNAPIKRQILYGVWPKIVSPIQLDMTRKNTLNMFVVSFHLDDMSVYAEGNEI